MSRWLQVGDPHAREGDDWKSLGLFEGIAAQVNEHLRTAIKGFTA